MLFKLFTSGINFLRKYGINNFLYRTINYFFFIPDPINLKKKKVLDYLWLKFDAKVQYGPFKNMLLSKKNRWAKFDLTPQLLGTYEENIVKYILSIRAKNKELFVDIGAGDGYFVIGFTLSGLFENIYAFEISHEGREIIKKNEIKNNCLENIKIMKKADLNSLKEIENKFSNGVVLIDIEGAEYDLLNEDILFLLRKFHLIIEMHPFLIRNNDFKNKELMKRIKKFFNIEIIKKENYTPSKFHELSKFSEDEQLLALSEGRSEKTEWLILSPKNRKQ